jgi:predicted CopG family antitoxin
MIDSPYATFKYMFMFKHSMAVKTITVTKDAYDALRSMKEGDESFSEAILRISTSRVGNAARWFGTLKKSDVLRRKISIWRKGFDNDMDARMKHTGTQ